MTLTKPETITDLAGKTIMEQNGTANHPSNSEQAKQINVTQLQQGIYLLQIKSEGKSSVTKFIKQ